MSDGCLPDVVYIGNMRSGSAFTRSFLGSHPDVHWTRRAWYFQLGASDDERRATYPKFFASLSPNGMHVDMYEALFLGQYFKSPPRKKLLQQEHPEWQAEWALVPDSKLADGPVAIDPREIARRIAGCVPNAKILVMLREQVDWMRSMFQHHLSLLPKHRRSFGDFTSTLEGQAAWRALRYDEYLEPYLDLFGRERVHVMFLEDLERDLPAELDRLCDFLEIRHFEFERERWWRNEGMSPTRARRLRYGPVLGTLMGRKEAGVLTAAEVTSIRGASAESNRRVQGLLEVDLGRVGYWLGTEDPALERTG